ncbi:hypothetical protein FTUN_3361 [Frigoriglobus tundricola]|uniref:Uncharacterized protein n=1 Tax=Frigoriglobus tundricola TaxID=2774151 RepID=A0A6M5YNZ8_9BACT|nr:hypothetical protein FTUN_3361 [Frigoriglobus tundricola]
MGAPALADPAAEALVGLVRTLFVLPARARAVRRNTWLREQAAHVEKWRAALAVVQRAAPALVALEPRLRAALAPDFALAAFVAGASAAPVRAPQPIQAVAHGDRSRPRAVQPGSSGGGWIGGAAVFGLFVIIKLLVSLGSSSRTPSYSPVPPKTQYPVPDGGRSSAQNAADLRKQFEESQKALDAIKKRHNETNKLPAGRSSSVPGANLPVEDRPSYSFDRGLIEMCRDYEEGKTRIKPWLYGRWEAAGKPTVPGAYPLIHQTP